VWHLDESSGTQIGDSTSYGNTGTKLSATEPNPAAGQLAGAQYFDGTNDIITINNSSGIGHVLDFTAGPFTLSAWFNTQANNRHIVGKRAGAPDQYQFGVGAADPPNVFFGDSDEEGWGSTGMRYDGTTWYYGTVVVDASGNPELYVNGAQETWNGDARPFTFTHEDVDVTIGMHTAAPFHGSIDEVRISSVARSAEWIQTEYNNQKAPAAFYTVGIEESPGAGADPLNNGWSFRKRLTIDSAQIGCDLTNFPLLIKTTDPDLTQAQGDFDDILFTAADGSTKLDHEIEKYNSATGEIVAWVEVTSVSSTTDTDIYIYYANATAVDQRNPTGAGVWEPNYVGVYHLAEDPSITTDGHCGGGSVHACDSTSNDNDGTSLGGMQPGDLVPAQIGNGLVFDGNDDEIQINTTTDFDASVVTVQAWINTSDDKERRILVNYDNSTYNWYFTMEDNGVGNASVLFSNTGNTSVNQMTDNFYNDGNWHHVVAVSDHSDYTNIKIYVDGSSVSTSTDIEAWGGSPGNNPSIANQIAAGSFFGTLDEIRVSIGERDACWIEAEHTNQSNPAGFLTIGIEEQPGTVGDPFQNGWTYRKRLTIDASRVAGDLTNFPVLINTTDLDWKEDSQPTPGHVAQTDGGDIMFTAADGVTKLDHEIEKYDETTGELVAWVSGTNNTDIYIYYGNTSLAEDENQWNSVGVWSNGFVGVWHLHDDFNDSTSEGNSGTNSGSADDTGKMANGQYFDSVDDIYTGTNSTMANAEEVTISAWIKPDSSQTDWAGILEYRDSAAGWETVLEVKSTSKFSFGVWTDTWHNLESIAVVPTTGFSHIVGVYNGSNQKTYIDGQLDNTSGSITGNLRNNSRPFHIGRNPGDAVTFNGAIDEVRISNVARSPEWIATEHNNQQAPAAF
jgi:hypothetical protein